MIFDEGLLGIDESAHLSTWVLLQDPSFCNRLDCGRSSAATHPSELPSGTTQTRRLAFCIEDL